MRSYTIDLKVGSYRTEVFVCGSTEEEAVKNAVRYIEDSFGIKRAYTVYSIKEN